MLRRPFYILILTLLFLVNQSFPYLDINELSSFQYSIDISSKPVLLDENKEKEGILLSSKHGQKYQCLFESVSQISQKVKEEEETASKTSVPELLQPLENKPCLVLTTGWWTYEFCYKKHIKQYHLSDQKIAGDVLTLGSYSDEFDWNATHDKKRTPEISSRYHSQQYMNGSLCDLTGAMRSAEVRFKCKEEAPDTLDGVEEPVTCTYLLHASTSRTCKHPSLKPVANKKSLPVTCSPVLSDSDYKEYLEFQKRLEEEKEKEDSVTEEEDGGGKKTPVTRDNQSTQEGSSDVDKITGGSDLEDGEYGFLDIGNTRIKFYVLSYDGETITEGDIKEGEDGTTEQRTTDGTSLEKTPSSSSSSHEGSDTKVDDNDEAEKRDKWADLYTRLMSNRKLKSFVKKTDYADHHLLHRRPQKNGDLVEETPTSDAAAESVIATATVTTIRTATTVTTTTDDKTSASTASEDEKKDDDSGEVQSNDNQGADIKASLSGDNDPGKKHDGEMKDETKGDEVTREKDDIDTNENKVGKDATLPIEKNKQSVKLTLDHFVVQEDYSIHEGNEEEFEKTVLTWEGRNTKMEKIVFKNGIKISIKDGTVDDDSDAHDKDRASAVTPKELEKANDIDKHRVKKEVTTSIKDDKLDDGNVKVTENGGSNKEESEDTAETQMTKEFKKKKVDIQVLGDLFKKGGGGQVSDEHKSIHQMILAIVRQTDRSTKELTRHEAIEKNYGFDWKKQKEEEKAKKLEL